MKFDNFRDDNELFFSILLIIKIICSLSSFFKGDLLLLRLFRGNSQ